MKMPLFLLTALGRRLHRSGAQTLTANAAANPAVNTTRMLWEQLTAYITTAAAELPEPTYSYRPTADVRSFGQLVGHIAGAQYLICGAAMGEPPREEDEIDRSRTSKTELLAA